ncbi:enoyl-CoA hydratase-related protein, partial [Pseudomonas aeruginosa]
LTIQREDRRNAINAAVLEALTAALVDAGRDAAVRAVVLTGTGTRAFCAGADLQTGQSFRFDYSQPYQALA